ncbi:MAG: CHAT domain-containing protein [Vulcanimicrobiota bacterium]
MLSGGFRLPDDAGDDILLWHEFHPAGARTVVMSLWTVPGRKTQELMTGFYKRLKKGEGKAQALQGASIRGGMG